MQYGLATHLTTALLLFFNGSTSQNLRDWQPFLNFEQISGWTLISSLPSLRLVWPFMLSLCLIPMPKEKLWLTIKNVLCIEEKQSHEGGVERWSFITMLPENLEVYEFSVFSIKNNATSSSV